VNISNDISYRVLRGKYQGNGVSMYLGTKRIACCGHERTHSPHPMQIIQLTIAFPLITFIAPVGQYLSQVLQPTHLFLLT